MYDKINKKKKNPRKRVI